jgi:hypothetical protein
MRNFEVLASQHRECEKSPVRVLGKGVYDHTTGLYTVKLTQIPNFQGMVLEATFEAQILESIEALAVSQIDKLKRRIPHVLSIPTVKRLQGDTLEIKMYSSTEAIAEWQLLRKRLYDLGGFKFPQTTWQWADSMLENGEVVSVIAITDNAPVEVWIEERHPDENI